MDTLDSVRRLLDALPRTRLRRGGVEVPAFRACGVAGFYCAALVALAGGLLKGLSPQVVALLALVCALSFFAYAHARRLLTGRENLVLFEHVWFALLSSALALYSVGEPVLPYLDVVCVGLCAFLAAGRVGCLLVGCCHGQPSSVGLSYGEDCADEGFPAHLVGVRLFPVPAVEAAGWLFIGACGFAALPFAAAGRVLVWFLLSYGIMRFGLEGLRGDARPHVLGLSHARWMALCGVLFALWLSQGARAAGALVYVTVFASLVAWSALSGARGRCRRLTSSEHVREVRGVVLAELCAPRRDGLTSPVARRTSSGLCVAVSRGGATLPAFTHISLSLPRGRADLPLLCDLAARAFPELVADSAQYTERNVLHFAVPLHLGEDELTSAARDGLARALYGHVVRRLQRARETRAAGVEPGQSHSAAPPAFGEPQLWQFERRGVAGG
ncbi:MAG: prolipoprotein diacylglyceryl transferase [Acidobacteriota bacterium]|nr:prolipoprotein diacylglyceryl transferase [Acidobacteriota bacterium]